MEVEEVAVVPVVFFLAAVEVEVVAAVPDFLVVAVVDVFLPVVELAVPEVVVSLL